MTSSKDAGTIVVNAMISTKPKTNIFMQHMDDIGKPIRPCTLQDVMDRAKVYIKATKAQLVEHLTMSDVVEFGDIRFAMDEDMLKTPSQRRNYQPPVKSLTGALKGMDEFLRANSSYAII